jgi:hypothetical protein
MKVFLVLLDRSDIATPDGTGPFLILSRFHVEFSIFRPLAMVDCPRSESQ